MNIKRILTAIQTILGSANAATTYTVKGKLDDIEAAATAVVASTVLTGDAVVANVLIGKKFYKDDVETQLTGTMPDSTGNITPDGTLIPIPAGYHSGLGSVQGSAFLLTENIKAGVTIYGVAGKTEVIDTYLAADFATASDIALGKKAFVNGVLIEGTAE